jgi:cobalt-zinc-cadmium efflux system membrane fusion protein
MKTITLAALLALLLAACGDKQTAPAAANHHEEAAEKLTDFSDKTELYVEFPSLTVGRTASFAAHVTQLADFKPLAQGKLTVVLSGGNAPEERFVADTPAVPGIFKPGVTPKAAGERELSLIVESALGTITHELGPVTDIRRRQVGRRRSRRPRP